MPKMQICYLIVSAIKTFLSNQLNLDPYKGKNRFVRKRKLSMIDVIMYLFFTDKTSMDNNLPRIKELFKDIENFPKKISKQAISHARQGISPELFSTLFNLSVSLFYDNIPDRKDFHGYQIIAIDGSKFELPNSSENFKMFGELFNPFNPDSKYTQAMVSIAYDVLDDFIMNASMNPYLGSERDAARNHMDALKNLDICNNAILIFDRGYYSEDMFRYCVDNNILCLMRLKDSSKFSKKAGKKTSDFIDVLPADPKKNTPEIKVRIIAVKLNTGEYEFLATNIFDDSFTTAMFRKLYFLRWPIEVKYNELKNRFQIEEFNGATSVSVLQEFYINLLLSNICALIKSDSDDFIEANNDKNNKHRYKSNRSFIIGQVKRVLPGVLFGLREITDMGKIFDESIGIKVPFIPNRSNPRKAKKNNKRTHHKLKKAAF